MSKPLKVFGDANFLEVFKCFDWKTTHSTKDCPLPGFFVEVIKLIGDRLNRTIQFIDAFQPDLIPPDINMNEISDDDFLFNILRNGSADFTTYFNYNVSDAGLEVTLPLFHTHTKFIVAPVESKLIGFFDFFLTFDFYIWISACFAFVLSLLTGLLIYLIASKIRTSESRSFGSFIWSNIRMHLLQSETIKLKLVSGNFLVLIFACLQCGIIIRMYNNLVTTQAINYVNPKPFKENELVKVLKEKRYSLIFQTRLKEWYTDIMNENSTRSPLYEIRHAIQDNPIIIAKDLTDSEIDDYVYEKVKRGRYVTIEIDEIIQYHRQLGYCNFIYFDTGFSPKPKHLLMRKNHPLLPQINQIILDETVNIRRLHDKYYKYARPSKCDERERGPKALTLIPFYGIIILFGIGCLCSVIMFFGEIWLKIRQNTLIPTNMHSTLPNKLPPATSSDLIQKSSQMIATHERITKVK